MKILADDNIPFLRTGLGSAGTLITKPGRTITKKDCEDADILFVRSVTPVNAGLLKDTAVRFVGSATTGHDHLDTAFLNEAGIMWTTAAGCNSMAVADYMISLLAAVQSPPFHHLRAAVIGAGRIGSVVAERLQQLGFQVVIVDPFRKDIPTVDLNSIEGADLITLHTPLTLTGPHPTFHMINSPFLARQKPGCLLINTGRGAAICTNDLKQHQNRLQWCLDVFEHEPRPDAAIVNGALIATPHIAGYSAQAKQRGAEMLCVAACKAGVLPTAAAFPPLPQLTLSFENNKTSWQEVVLRAFDPRITSHQMKSALQQSPHQFDELRKNFSFRHEFAFIEIKDVQLSPHDKTFLINCGFNLDIY